MACGTYAETLSMARGGLMDAFVQNINLQCGDRSCHVGGCRSSALYMLVRFQPYESMCSGVEGGQWFGLIRCVFHNRESLNHFFYS